MLDEKDVNYILENGNQSMGERKLADQRTLTPNASGECGNEVKS